MNNDYISRADVLAERQTFAVLGIPDLVDAVLIEDIEAIPAAGVRPVVPCRDCQYYSDGWCYNPNAFDDEKTRGNTSPEWFCADGKRRGADHERTATTQKTL